MQKRKAPKRKKAKISLHPRERKKAIEAKLTKNNSAKLLAKNFDFDHQEYLNKSLLFDLKEMSKEHIFEAMLEKIPDDDKYYIQLETEQIPSEYGVMKNRVKKTTS